MCEEGFCSEKERNGNLLICRMETSKIRQSMVRACAAGRGDPHRAQKRWRRGCPLASDFRDPTASSLLLLGLDFIGQVSPSSGLPATPGCPWPATSLCQWEKPPHQPVAWLKEGPCPWGGKKGPSPGWWRVNVTPVSCLDSSGLLPSGLAYFS